MYVTWDAPAGNTDKLKKPGKMVLCVKTRAGPPPLGSARLIMADYCRTSRSQRAKRPLAGVCRGVDGGRGKWSVREDSGDPVVSLAISPCVAASFSRRRCSHWGQFKVSSIHLLLFQMWTWPHSPLRGFGRRMPRKNTKEHRHGGPSHSLAKGKAFWTIVQRPAMLGMEMNTRKRGAWGESYESHRKMCVGPLKQLCSTSLMRHGDRCSVTWK